MEQNKQNTALLVMDMQAGIKAMLPPNTGDLISNIAKAIASARENNIPVIYVTVGFRPGAPEISPNNKSFSGTKERMTTINMAEFMAIIPEIAPKDGEVVVIKRRFSAFTGSDLEVNLRAVGAQHLVLTGVSTSGVILSTLREAADKDYRLTVLEDCCTDSDEEVHHVLTTKVFVRQADVIPVDEWIKQ